MLNGRIKIQPPTKKQLLTGPAALIAHFGVLDLDNLDRIAYLPISKQLIDDIKILDNIFPYFCIITLQERGGSSFSLLLEGFLRRL